LRCSLLPGLWCFSAPPQFTPAAMMVSLLDAFQRGTVGHIAFGKYLSPDYIVHPGEYIPAVGMSTGTPQVPGTNADPSSSAI
jgi:hypothetical protein